MKRTVLRALAGLLTLIALSAAGGASYWLFYQPEVPKSLEK